MAKGLGKGLSALITEKKQYTEAVAAVTPSTEELVAQGGQLSTLGIQFLQPGSFQPRTYFQEEELHALADSIKQHGIIQPILVRKRTTEKTIPEAEYEIIAGERRYRAAKIAGLGEVPVIIMDIDNRRALEIGLIENVQRQNLQVLEEAEGYQRLIAEFEYTQEQLSEVIGRSRSQISNTLRLLALPEQVKQYLNEEKISSGHARALLAAEEEERINQLAEQVVKRSLSVRQTEELVKKLAEHPREQRNKKSAASNQQIISLQERITKRLGLELKIKHNDRRGRGDLVISYHSMAELDAILRHLDGVRGEAFDTGAEVDEHLEDAA